MPSEVSLHVALVQRCPTPTPPNIGGEKSWWEVMDLKIYILVELPPIMTKRGIFFTEITFWKGIAGILKALAGTGLSSTAIVGILGSQGRWQVVYQSLCTIPFLGLKVDMF